jgi:hypothetical protein
MPGMIDMVAATTQRGMGSEIIKRAPEHPRGRRGASWLVFEEAWGEFLDGYLRR